MPPVGYLLGGVDFSTLKIVLKPAVGGDPATEVAIRYGAFINAVVTFVIVALVVWQISRMFIKSEEPAEVKTCPFCLDANALEATKCKARTSAI